MKNYIRFLIGILFLLTLLYFVRWGSIVSRIKDVNYLFLTLSLLMIPVIVILSCIKWKILFDPKKYRINLFFLIRLYMIGYFFTNLLPSNVGGDVVRSYFLGRHIGSQNYAAVSVFLERFSGLLILLLLVVFSPITKPELYLIPAVIIPSSIAAIILLVIILGGRKKSTLKKLKRIVAKVLNILFWVSSKFTTKTTNRLNDKIDKVYRKSCNIINNYFIRLTDTLDQLKVEKSRMNALVALTLLFYFLSFVNIYFAFRTFDVHPAFRDIVAVIPIALMLNILPLSHGNIGFTEGIYVFYFALISIDPSATMTMALLIRFKLLFMGFIGCIFYLTHKERKYDFREFAN